MSNNKIPHPFLDTKGHISLLYNKTDNLSVQTSRLEFTIIDLQNKINSMEANLRLNTRNEQQPSKQYTNSNRLINTANGETFQVDFSDLGKVLEKMVNDYENKNKKETISVKDYSVTPMPDLTSDYYLNILEFMLSQISELSENVSPDSKAYSIINSRSFLLGFEELSKFISNSKKDK
jgi:hypothetical protein